MTRAWLMMAVLVAGSLAGFGALPAQAATLDVCPSGCPYTTIQQALAAAASGDTISVAPGTYPGGFTIGKNVTVVGSGAGQTSVMGAGKRGEDITVATGVTTAIEALTVDARAFGSNRSGDAVSNFGTLTVQNSTVTGSINNDALFNDFSGTLTVDHTTVSGNQTTDGILNAGGAVAIYRSTITKNSVGFSPITNTNGGMMTIAHSAISGNAGGAAGGVENDRGSTLTIRASTISRNDGAGIFNGVTAPGNPAATLTLYHVTVKDNFGASPAGIWNGQTGIAALHHSRVVRNNATAIPGGIGGILNQGVLALDHSIVRHNIPSNCVGCGHLAR
jgi:hypothetical protein